MSLPTDRTKEPNIEILVTKIPNSGLCLEPNKPGAIIPFRYVISWIGVPVRGQDRRAKLCTNIFEVGEFFCKLKLKSDWDAVGEQLEDRGWVFGSYRGDYDRVAELIPSKELVCK